MPVGHGVEDVVTVPEGRIHFAKTGSGTPVVLLHPMGTSTWAWDTVMDPLGQRFTCYAFDMLGQGQSDKPRWNFGIPDYARSLDQVMQAMNIRRAHIIGNGVGGALAVELAASYPDRADRLVLIGVPVWEPRNATQRIKDYASAYDENGMSVPTSLEELKANTTFANPRPEWVAKTNELRDQAGIWFRKTVEAFLYYDIVSRLPRIKAATTLVLNGELDFRRDTEDLLLYNIPNATKVVLPGLGHIPQIEGPQAFVSAVLDFLK